LVSSSAVAPHFIDNTVFVTAFNCIVFYQGVVRAIDMDSSIEKIIPTGGIVKNFV
jgi:hypothetical protein